MRNSSDFTLGDTSLRKHILTLRVGDPKLFDESRRENSTGESSTEDRLEFSVETTDTHILKLEVGRNDRLCRCPSHERNDEPRS
jgi:hypothetical protein